MTEWIEETIHDDFRLKMKVDRVLFEGHSENQHIVVVEKAAAPPLFLNSGASGSVFDSWDAPAALVTPEI